MLWEARVEATGKLEQRDVVVEEYAGRGEDEEAAVEVCAVLGRGIGVLVAEEFGMCGEHVGAWESAFVVFDLP